jgi:charged multivesicular body protein 2A
MWGTMMGFLGYKTPKQVLREHKRTLERAIRELAKEQKLMEKQEIKVKADIKKAVEARQMGAVRVMAKDLVRTRRYVSKFRAMQAQLQMVSLRIQTLQSTQAMATAMRGCVRAMHSLNRQLNLPQLQRIMMDFEKQSYIMDAKEELMGDALEEALGADEDEDEETDALVNQILDEINISINKVVADAPTALQNASQTQASKQMVEELEQVDLELAQRLRNLKG